MTAAQERLRKKYVTTVYQAEHGAIAQAATKASSEGGILKYKKYSQLPFAVILTDKAKQSLDAWQDLGDLPAYQNAVLECLRSLLALVNTQAVSKSSYSKQFVYNKHQITPVERIDKRLFAKTVTPVQPAAPESAAVPESVSQTEEMKLKMKMSKRAPAAAPSSLLNPSAIRSELLRGNGHITASFFVPDKETCYQSCFK
jgi:hypothetical protein